MLLFSPPAGFFLFFLRFFFFLSVSPGSSSPSSSEPRSFDSVASVTGNEDFSGDSFGSSVLDPSTSAKMEVNF